MIFGKKLIVDVPEKFFVEEALGRKDSKVFLINCILEKFKAFFAL
jgi:hypothetical protein